MVTSQKSVVTQVDKPDIDKLIEFYNFIKAMRALSDLVKQGKSFLLAPIYGQLRGMVTDYTKRKELKPYFAIAQKLGGGTSVYHVPKKMSLPKNILDSMTFSFESYWISVNKVDERQVEIELDDYLDLKVVSFGEWELSGRELINLFSDKYGGSHYDSKLPNHIANLLRNGDFNVKHLLDNYLLQLTDIVVELGYKNLKNIIEFDIYFEIFIESFPPTPMILYEFSIQLTSGVICIAANSSGFTFFIKDFLGKQAEYFIEVNIEQGKRFSINICHSVTHALVSEIGISINARRLEGIQADMLLMVNAFSQGDHYYNRGRNKEKQDYEFIVSQCQLYSAAHSNHERQEFLFKHFLPQPEYYLHIQKEAYGHQGPNEERMRFVGKVDQYMNDSSSDQENISPE